MKITLLHVLFLLSVQLSIAQTYFPPLSGDVWDTTSPADYEWCDEKIDSLYAYLESQNSKAFILLIDGKIVLEQYFDGHTASATWYWASAGKTITSFMVGMAQQENFLNIEDPTSQYLGEGWTNSTAEQEVAITIWNQLTMTSGLNESPDPFCTIDTCLNYLAEPNTRWSYHNGPYTLLDQVIESATGMSLNLYTTQKLKNPTGMTGLFVAVDFNNVYFSNARSMARYGLLIQNNGNWNGNQIMTDTEYFNAMINTSQDLNKSYGYLWWLTGKESYMVPGLQFTIPGNLVQNAPSDNVMALGRDGQLLNVAPSQNMVWMRMGNAPTDDPVPFLMNDKVWDYINNLSCSTVSSPNESLQQTSVYPNPFQNQIKVEGVSGNAYFQLINIAGQVVWEGKNIEQKDFTAINAGLYFLKVKDTQKEFTIKIIKSTF